MNRKSSNSQPDVAPGFDCNYVRGRVSVIIPTYNYGTYVRGAIDSALRQRVPDVEIIVVDDGSTDGTADILDPYEDRIKYIYQKNAGLSAARNTGIANSTGEFIDFLDADDMLGPGSLGLQLDYLDRHPEVYIAVCRNRLFELTFQNGHPRPFGSWRLFQGNLDLHLCYFNIGPPHAFLSRRKAIIETGCFDTKLRACEDYDFWLRAAVRGFIPHYNPLGVVYYRRHHASMSANLLNQHLHDGILHHRLSALLDQHPEFPERRRLEGLMAFSSGALLTAARLHDHNVEGTQDLIELALRRIEDASRIALSKNSNWNIFMKLYCFRILSLLSHPCLRASSVVVDTRKNLKDILMAVKAPRSQIGLMAAAFISTMFGSGECLWERWQLGRLSLKYLRNSRLCLPLQKARPAVDSRIE